MKWKTNDIMQDLKKLLVEKGLKAEVKVEDYPGGDYDTPNICLWPELPDVDLDAVYACGYNTRKTMEGVDPKNPPHDIEYVEIRNYGSDSDGGLSHDAAKETRELYYVLIDYFKTRGVSIIRHYDQIF